jgi:hypothetical protein
MGRVCWKCRARSTGVVGVWGFVVGAVGARSLGVVARVSGKVCGGAGDDAELSRSSVGFRVEWRRGRD